MNQKEILEALKTVKDPELGRDIVSLEMVQDLKIEGNLVSLRLVLTTPACPLKSKIEEDIKRALHSVAGVGEVAIQWDAQVKKAASLKQTSRLIGVKNIIAVASGKGGVGKSTVAVNLALALHQLSSKVGILDADIYGPSIPTLFGLKEKQPVIDPEKKKILPLEKFGLKIMSIGFLMRETDAVIWRGPMIHKMLEQFMDDVEWGELDYLIVDLPPGTGDVQISLSQLIPLSGVVVVTTPQDVALADVTRAITMFQKVNIPILGVVENMSYFVCPHCETKSEIFSHGGGRKLAEKMGFAFLGELPLDPKTREGSDLGVPVLVQSPDSFQSKSFLEISQKTAGQLSVMNLEQIKIEL